MRPTSLLAVLLLATLAGCGALGGVAGPGGGGSTPTLTPAAVPTDEPTRASSARPGTPTAASGEPGSPPVLLENALTRDYVVILSVVDGPVSVVEVYYRNGGVAVVDYAADPSGLDARLAEGRVVGVRASNNTGVARYRVAASASAARRPFPELDHAGAGTSVVWVVAPVGEPGVPAYVAAAGVESCAPPHSLVTGFRVRVAIGTDRVRVDCA
jgi:hypothetical protein